MSAVHFNVKYKKAEMDLSKKEQREVQKEEMKNWKELRDFIKIKGNT